MAANPLKQVVLASILLIGSAQAVLCSATPAKEATTSPEVVAEMVVRFIMPVKQLIEFNLGSCDNTYRTRLSRIEGWNEKEAAMPGLTDYMVNAVVAHCRSAIPPLFDAEIAWARSRVAQYMTPAESAKIYPLIAPEVANHEAFDWAFQPGETAHQAVQSTIANARAMSVRFEARAKAFAARPGNAGVFNKLAQLQSEGIVHAQRPTNNLAPVLKEAVRLGDMAGNDFAKAHGYAAIFAPR